MAACPGTKDWKIPQTSDASFINLIYFFLADIVETLFNVLKNLDICLICLCWLYKQPACPKNQHVKIIRNDICWCKMCKTKREKKTTTKTFVQFSKGLISNEDVWETNLVPSVASSRQVSSLFLEHPNNCFYFFLLIQIFPKSVELRYWRLFLKWDLALQWSVHKTIFE